MRVTVRPRAAAAGATLAEAAGPRRG